MDNKWARYYIECAKAWAARGHLDVAEEFLKRADKELRQEAEKLFGDRRG